MMKDGIKYDIVMVIDMMDNQRVYVISDEKILNARDHILFYGLNSFFLARITMMDLNTGAVKVKCETFINPMHVIISDCRKIVCSNDVKADSIYMTEAEIFEKYDV